MDLEKALKTQTWKEYVENPHVLAIYLHGSCITYGSGNDIDIVIVMDKCQFSNVANEKLLGFEHIRHSDDGLDRYITDIDHFALVKEILQVSEKPLFQRQAIPLNMEVVKASYDMSKTLLQSDIKQMINTPPRSEDQWDREWVSNFWIFNAEHSWKSWIKRKGDDKHA